VAIRVQRNHVTIVAGAPLTIELAGTMAQCRSGETSFPFEPPRTVEQGSAQ
jgi:hypothetical protein